MGKLVPQDGRIAADIRHDRTQAAAHRFEKTHGRSLTPGAHCEDRECREQFNRVVAPAEEASIAGNPKLRRQTLEGVAFPSVAGKDQDWPREAAPLEQQAGVRVLPVVDMTGSTERQILSGSLALVAVSLLPTLIGLAGGLYFTGALVLGLGLVALGAAQARTPSPASARRVMFASLLYLPTLLALLALDKL